jgi:hypothetical protein
VGYRSDVSIVFYTSNPDKLPFVAIKLWFDENYPHQTATTYWGAKVDCGDDYVLVTYTDAKWYKEYEHVIAADAAIKLFTDTFEANEFNGHANYETVRIGEQLDDVAEERSDYADYRLGLRRDITFA